MNEISVEHLCFGYTAKDEILHDVSFEIEKGGFYGVIGPNGGGKSTLLKLLLGLLKPQSGRIFIPPEAQAAYVPQTFRFDRLFPITALEVVLGGRIQNLSCWGRFSDEDRDIAQLKLAQVGLSHLANQRFGSLSQGQAQRVLIARALSSKPSILLLDEPTSSSDPSAQVKTFEVIETLQNSMTILMVTHSITTILEKVQGVLCVQGGAVTISPKDLCEHFALGLYHEPLIDAPNDHFDMRTKGP